MKPKFLLKLFISALMLVVVFQFIELENLKTTLVSIPWWVFGTVFLGYILGQVLSAFKWWLIASEAEISVPYLKALKAYFIGMFVNCFGLGIVGGDVTRGILLVGKQKGKTKAIASVVADRMHGLGILALLGTATTLLLGRQDFDSRFLVGLSAIGIVLVLGWFLGPFFVLRLTPKESTLRQKVEGVLAAFPKDFRLLLLISVLSAIFHLLQISLHWVMGVGMGVHLEWSLILVAIPFVNIASSLPISWNGLGVRENAYIFFLTSGALTSEQAVAMGAIWLLAMTIGSAVGGIIAFLSKEPIPRAEVLGQKKAKQRGVEKPAREDPKDSPSRFSRASR